MSYVLGFITADGCITVSKERPNRPFSLNITSVDKKHLYKIRKVLNSEHKISKKTGGEENVAFQIQIRNQIIVKDLMKLGIFPRKTSHLNPIKVPQKYFNSFVRGFFDGDGTVYIYKVNNTPQIKVDFISTSYHFIGNLNSRICDNLGIPLKNIHRQIPKNRKRLLKYSICFYIDDCERLYKFMYKNASIFLNRKHRVFKKWENVKLKNRRYYIKQNYPSKIGWHLNQKVLV